MTIPELVKIVGNDEFLAIFIKKDGTIREMKCKLDLEANQEHFVPEARGLVPVLENEKHKFVNLNTLQKLIYKDQVICF